MVIIGLPWGLIMSGNGLGCTLAVTLLILGSSVGLFTLEAPAKI